MVKEKTNVILTAELVELFYEVMNLGMGLRQDQLSGHDTRGGNVVLHDWFKEKFKPTKEFNLPDTK